MQTNEKTKNNTATHTVSYNPARDLVKGETITKA